MKTTKTTLLFSAVFFLFGCGDDYNEYKNPKNGGISVETDPRQEKGPAEAKYNLEFPALSSNSNCIVLVHRATLNDKTKEQGINYCVEWDTNQRTQHWTCYKAYSNIVRSTTSSNNVSRYSPNNNKDLTPTSQYPNDPDLPSQYQFTVDPYRGSGYDHGHICPSADRLRSTDANYQTFFMTNMQPQSKAFNGSHKTIPADYSPWYRIEDRTRTWAAKADTLYVCKGGIVDSNSKTIGSGNNKIPVPSYFFVALLSKKGSTYSAIGFYMKHESSYSSQLPLSNYAMTIKELEELTGYDFFCNLPNDIEQEVENMEETKMLNDWSVQ